MCYLRQKMSTLCQCSQVRKCQRKGYKEPSHITFAFFGILPYTFLSLYFLCSKRSIFLTTYPPLNGNVICKDSIMVLSYGSFLLVQMGLKIKRGKWDQILSRYIFVVQLYGCLPLENQMVFSLYESWHQILCCTAPEFNYGNCQSYGSDHGEPNR